MSPSLRDLGGRDPYEVLGVPRTAGPEQILAAYRRKVRTVHPDAATGDLHAATLLNVARDVLSDPETRREYDRRRDAGSDEPVTAPPASPWDDAPTSGWDEPPASLWDDPDVVGGAADPPRPGWRPDAPPSGPVVTEFLPDPPSSPPYPHDPSYPRRPPYPPPQAYPFPPPYGPRRGYPPPGPPGPSSGMSLGVLALLLTLVCGPVSLVLGIVALSRRPAPGSADRTCALLAIGINGITLCCGASYFGLLFVGALAGQP
ncbi:J domain-containing protein [Micromonospora sp. WMMD882]|uniref:J domain-containing protein n=1 Tax=Micromonospora sp. WMMD882 TaxID=3015151 RepID=UPI00248B868C|nr:J domain-containing protein [Micromonospora sp. WMMD882]WBB80554.1 J domain-containing protein [Micromonospora sp. WMMD882]